jgi:anaerobic sulfite reductase subunit B
MALGLQTAMGMGPFTPAPHLVATKREETVDVVTLSLEPLGRPAPAARAGQFNMLTAFGLGEVAISLSSAPGAPGPIEHTVRDVGAVTHALCRAPVGSVIGVRGPFGTDWAIEHLAGEDVVVVAGGIGLAPLRGAVQELVDARAAGHGGRLVVLVGARSPDQVVFTSDLERWRRDGAEVHVTVDVADSRWSGSVGVVTTLIEAQGFDPERTTALVCGPEVMMRFTARALLDKGLRPDRIRISLERNMQCGIGLCGHCQLGPLLLCRDGPIVTYAGVVPRLLSEPEL